MSQLNQKDEIWAADDEAADEEMGSVCINIAEYAFEHGDFQTMLDFSVTAATLFNDPAGLFYQGLIYRDGLGAEPDRLKALEYFRQAAEASDDAGDEKLRDRAAAAWKEAQKEIAQESEEASSDDSDKIESDADAQEW